jgi:large subunit ribosomal protein L17
VARIVREIAPHYKDRNGGYTRILKFRRRPGDNAELCVFELIGDYALVKKVEEDKSREKKKDKPEKDEKAPKIDRKELKERIGKKAPKVKSADTKAGRKDNIGQKKG